jgi:hypothetical protein
VDIVTGMHRSGTSLVARICYEAGFDLGRHESFYPGDKWNPHGYYEQLEVLRINRSLLHGNWGRLTYLCLPSAETILRRAKEESCYIREVSSRFCACILKDPRFCLTLPAWNMHGPAIERCIVCIRHPQAVARSIQRRNLVPLSLAYHLWQVHNERLLEEIQNKQSWLINYHILMDYERSESEIKSLLHFLGKEICTLDLRNLRDRVIRVDCDHHNLQGLLEADLPPSVQSLWGNLLDLYSEQPGCFSPFSMPIHVRGTRAQVE